MKLQRARTNTSATRSACVRSDYLPVPLAVAEGNGARYRARRGRKGKHRRGRRHSAVYGRGVLCSQPRGKHSPVAPAKGDHGRGLRAPLKLQRGDQGSEVGLRKGNPFEREQVSVG